MMMHVTTYLKGLFKAVRRFMHPSKQVDVHWLTCDGLCKHGGYKRVKVLGIHQCELYNMKCQTFMVGMLLQYALS